MLNSRIRIFDGAGQRRCIGEKSAELRHRSDCLRSQHGTAILQQRGDCLARRGGRGRQPNQMMNSGPLFVAVGQPPLGIVQQLAAAEAQDFQMRTGNGGSRMDLRNLLPQFFGLRLDDVVGIERMCGTVVAARVIITKSLL